MACYRSYRQGSVGIWPTGGAWLFRHLWERYLYTGDMNSQINAATASQAGVMTAADKVKLDTTLPNQIAIVISSLPFFS